MSAPREWGGAPVDDEPCCPECGEAVDVAGARCAACIDAPPAAWLDDSDDDGADIDFDLKTAIENAA